MAHSVASPQRHMAQAQALRTRDLCPHWLAARAAHNSRRPDAIFVARAAPDGELVPIGSAELGHTREERGRLQAELERRRTTTRRAHIASARIWVEVDFHGPEHGPLRDAVRCKLVVDDPPD